MATSIVMPKLGMGMENGTVVAWMNKIGDEVGQGKGIVVIHSEKIEFEVESPTNGVLIDILVPEEGVVPYGTVIGYIGAPGEQPPSLENSKQPDDSIKSKSRTVIISPVARKMAEEAKGLDVNGLRGTGPGGRITKEDVERAIVSQKQQGTSTTTMENTESLCSSETRVPMDAPSNSTLAPARMPLMGMRKTIAMRMSQSLQESAQLTITMSVDVTDARLLIRQHAENMRDRYDLKLTITDFVARAATLALIEHPIVNSTWSDFEVIQHNQVHLGIAVALDDGLIVPVIQNAERMSLVDLAKVIKSLSQRAKSGKLSSNETGGSTFTITNLGAYGVEFFTPILNPPETGILGVGSAQDIPAYVGENLQRRSLLPLSLTFDHRVLDGVPAAKFLGNIKRYLEDPISMLF